MSSEKLTDVERAASIAAFSKLGLCPQLAEAAASLGWKTPSPIQEQAVPHLLQGELPYCSWGRCSRRGGGSGWRLQQQRR